MKINCNMCKLSLSTPTMLSLGAGIFLLAYVAAFAVAATTIPVPYLQQQAFAQNISTQTEPGSVLKLAENERTNRYPVAKGI